MAPLTHWTYALSTPQGSLVYVIDDESEVRRSLHFLLLTIGLVTWPFASAQDFLDNFDTLEPAPILLDIRMPAIDGLQLMSILHQRAVNWPIIAISAHGDVQVAVNAIKLGAADFLEKPFKFDELKACLRAALTRLADLIDSYTTRNSARTAFTLLTPREHEIITLLMRGIPNKSVAHRLALSVRTVEMHRAHVLEKLQVKSIAEVVRLANVANLDEKCKTAL